MALYPQGDKLDNYPSRYVLANLAARRAKQIKDGAPILVETESTHPLTIALEEIADDAVRAIIIEGEIQPEPTETLETLDLLAKEAGGLEGLGDIGAFLGGEPDGAGGAAFGGGALGDQSEDFEDEMISLDDLLMEEQSEDEEEAFEGGGDGEEELD